MTEMEVLLAILDTVNMIQNILAIGLGLAIGTIIFIACTKQGED